MYWKIIDLQELMSNFKAISMSADGLASPCARTSSGATVYVFIKYLHRMVSIYIYIYKMKIKAIQQQWVNHKLKFNENFVILDIFRVLPHSMTDMISLMAFDP